MSVLSAVREYGPDDKAKRKCVGQHCGADEVICDYYSLGQSSFLPQGRLNPITWFPFSIEIGGVLGLGKKTFTESLAYLNFFSCVV